MSIRSRKQKHLASRLLEYTMLPATHLTLTLEHQVDNFFVSSILEIKL